MYSYTNLHMIGLPILCHFATQLSFGLIRDTILQKRTSITTVVAVQVKDLKNIYYSFDYNTMHKICINNACWQTFEPSIGITLHLDE
jgi:hypothetical protein